MEFHAWPFIVVCGCVAQLISWLNEKAISKWGVAFCTLSPNIFFAFDSFSKAFRNCLKSMLLMLCDCSVGVGCGCV